MKKENNIKRFIATKLAPVLGAGAIGVCPLCWTGSAALFTYLGLGSLIPLWQWLAGILLAFGLIGFYFDYRAHKNIFPIILYAIGATGLFIGRYIFGGVFLWLPSALFILVAVVYNKRFFNLDFADKGNTPYKNKKDDKKDDVNITNIICPKCAHVQVENIPQMSCQPFYVCKGCGKTISVPKESENCCVFCEYADKKCPAPNKKIVTTNRVV